MFGLVIFGNIMTPVLGSTFSQKLLMMSGESGDPGKKQLP